MSQLEDRRWRSLRFALSTRSWNAVLRGFANSEGLSLNQAALKLLRKATGLEGEGSGQRVDRVGAAVDAHIGTWSDEEARELLEYVADFEVIDEEMWK